MASNIVPGNVDGTFPTAGQDNSSQGFRDNFTAIKNNFTEAKTDIESLQTNKASLNASSDFNNNEVLQAKFKDTSETVFAHGTTGGAITLNHANGHYQTMTVNLPVATSTVAFNLSDWPARAMYAEMIVGFLGNGTAKTSTFTVSGGGTIKYDTNYPKVSSVPTLTIDSAANPLLIKFWTYNSGTTVFAQYLGQYT